MRLDVNYVEIAPQMGDTIDALLKLYNRHDLKYVHMVQLRHLFYTLNNTDIIRIGTKIKLPVLYREGIEEVAGSISQMREIRQGKKTLENYQDIDTDDPDVIKLKDDRTVITKIKDLTLEKLGLKKKIEPPEEPKGEPVKISIKEIVPEMIEEPAELEIVEKVEHGVVEVSVAIEEVTIVEETIEIEVEKESVIPELIHEKVVKTVEVSVSDEFIPLSGESFEEAEARLMKEQGITNRTIKRFKRSLLYKTLVKHFLK